MEVYIYLIGNGWYIGSCVFCFDFLAQCLLCKGFMFHEKRACPGVVADYPCFLGNINLILHE
jgi:hypothetical protein